MPDKELFETGGEDPVKEGILQGLTPGREPAGLIHYDAVATDIERTEALAMRIGVCAPYDPVAALIALGGVDSARQTIGEEATETILRLIKRSEAES